MKALIAFHDPRSSVWLPRGRREGGIATARRKQEGRCQVSDYDWPRSALEVTATAEMSYKVRLSCGPFGGDEWAIFAPLHAANET